MSATNVGSAAGAAPADESCDLNVHKDMTTQFEQLHGLLKGYPGDTILDKVTGLVHKITTLEETEATAKRLLNGFKPDILAKALKTVKDPGYQFSVHTTSALGNAYDRVIEEADDLFVGGVAEERLAAETETTTSAPPPPTPPQDPFLRDITSGAHQARVKALEDEARRVYFADQEGQAVAGRRNRHASCRPKYTPKYRTWCQREVAAKAQPKRYEACERKGCPFYHEDQDEYFHSEDYMRDRNAEQVGDWEQLEEYTGRAGTNISKEKACWKERSMEGKFKKLLKRNIATEAKANKEQADKKRKAAIEAKATTDVALKKRKAGAAPSPNAKADKVVKKNEDGQTES